MVSTYSKNISQNGSFPRIGVKIKKNETTNQKRSEIPSPLPKIVGFSLQHFELPILGYEFHISSAVLKIANHKPTKWIDPKTVIKSIQITTRLPPRKETVYTTTQLHNIDIKRLKIIGFSLFFSPERTTSHRIKVIADPRQALGGLTPRSAFKGGRLLWWWDGFDPEILVGIFGVWFYIMGQGLLSIIVP